MVDLVQSLEKMAEREKVSFQKIIEIVCQSFEKAYRNYKKKSPEELVCVNFENDHFTIRDNEESISLKSFESDKSFSRQCVKEVSISLKSFRKDREYQYFYPLKNQIIGGKVQSLNENSKYCIVNLGEGLGYLDKKELKIGSKKDIFYLGNFLRFLITDVKKDDESTRVFISRNEDLFIKKIFEIEVPEVKSNIIKIEKVIRMPGLVSKVILSVGSREGSEKIDPIGVCIGKNKSRIKSILNELQGERIDLVLQEEKRTKMLVNLLSPSEVISVNEKDKNTLEVIVPEFRMSLILQYSGKIIQKIEDFLEKKIKIKTFESARESNESIVWNGNINFSDYEMSKKINIERFSQKK